MPRTSNRAQFQRMKHENPEMLLRIAQGDAYCAATEYIKNPRDATLKKNASKIDKYYAHPTHGLKPGQYTDDTQMSIAVAEVLVGEKPFTREKFADSFVRAFRRDMRKGYSRGFQSLLETVETGSELLETIEPTSDKNGAAMRSVPLGVLKTVEEVLQTAEIQARITHDTPDGISASKGVALLSHFALYEDRPMSEAKDYIRDHLPELTTWLGKFSDPVQAPHVGLKTFNAVFDVVTSNRSLCEMLEIIIERGGDTDSVAAIVWGIASARLKERLPDWFEQTLEPGGICGPVFLKNLGHQLMCCYA